MSVHGPARSATGTSCATGLSVDDARPLSRRSSISVALTTASTCDSAASADGGHHHGSGAFGRLLASPIAADAAEPAVSFFEDGLGAGADDAAFSFNALVDVDAELAKGGPAGFLGFDDLHPDRDHFDVLSDPTDDAAAPSGAPHQLPASVSAA